MKKISFLIALLFLATMSMHAQTNIAEARAMPLGSTVTVRGIVTNGPELGGIRYFQDATAGIAAYSWDLSDVQRGDSIEVTGVLKDYNQLLEIDPVNSFSILLQGLPDPEPVVITPDQMSEAVEAQVVRINHVLFNNAGGTFAGNTNYTITAGGESTQVRINNNCPLVGAVIPSGEVALTGICSQFSYSSPTSGYQLLLRNEDDIITGSSIQVISTIDVSNITTTGFAVTWETDIDGSTELFYGLTPALELGHLAGAGMGTDHTLDITGANPSDLLYVKVFSVAGSDTAFGPVRPFITESVSSGTFTIYFTRSVDTTVSTGISAMVLNNSADDTIIQYINRAKYTIDVAIYNFTIEGISNIANALNQAFFRGVRVRVVTDGSTGNSGIPELTAGIHKIARPAGDGIMHDKFMIIDGQSADPMDPIVWTGSCNWTEWNINRDPNNILFIQDMSLAKVYTLEFEEMWGSTTNEPNPANAKFGINKTDNTPHHLVIGGKPVEVYFSPSDGVNSVIIDLINQSNNDIEVNTMLITRTDIGYALRDRANIGINTRVIIDSEGTSGETVVETLEAALGNKFREYGETGMLHNKTMIVDQSNPTADPLVLTGSHNWSSSADQKNDENTLVIHDAGIANLYYQAFSERYKNGIPINQQNILNLGPDQEVCAGVEVLLDAGNFATYNWSTGDLTQTIMVDSTGVGIGTKEIWCRVKDFDDNYQWDTVYITFKDCSGIENASQLLSAVAVYPNPSRGAFHVSFTSQNPGNAVLEIRERDGRLIQHHTIQVIQGEQELAVSTDGICGGMYLLILHMEGIRVVKKLIVTQ